MKFSGKCLLFQKKILEGFGKVFRIISVGLILDCESNRLYDESIPDTHFLGSDLKPVMI